MDGNEYKGAAAVNRAWLDVIYAATEDLTILAGDMSFLFDARRLHLILKRKKEQGCKISVICRYPYPEEPAELSDAIAFLLWAGIEVRYRPDSLRTTSFTGLLTDEFSSGRNSRIALIHRNAGQVKIAIKLVDGSPGESREIDLWAAQIRAFREASNDALLFRRYTGENPTDVVAAGLRRVTVENPRLNQYANLRGLPTIKKVDLSQVSAWVLRVDKLEPVHRLVSHMIKQNLDWSQPLLLCSGQKSRVTIPPIVENHKGRYIAFDGTHRLWELYRRGFEHAHVVVVPAGPATFGQKLPGKPHGLHCLPIVRERIGPERRKAVFRGYKHKNYRRFGRMDDWLGDVGMSIHEVVVQQIRQRYEQSPE